MKCKQVQELMLTDYADGEVTDEQRRGLENHLAHCSRCREFGAASSRAVIEPFRRAERAEPPESVWRNIKAQIEGEQNKKGNIITQAPGSPKSWFVIRKPAFVMATIAAMLLIAVTLIQFPSELPKRVDINLEEQIDYAAYLLGETNGSSAGEGEGFGTSIEDYFL